MHWQSAKDSLLKPLIESSRVGLVTDVDGTISHIVNDPTAAQVTDRNQSLLAELSQLLPLVAALSGRGARDIHDRVGIESMVYIGNHGMERWHKGDTQLPARIVAYRPAMIATRESLEPYLMPGMILEDKGATLTLHYRQTQDPASVMKTFTPLVESCAAQHGLTMYQGRMVFEIRPPVDINKGTAFQQLIEEFDLSAAIYIGDDTTDADALRMAKNLRQEGICHAIALGVTSEDTPPLVLESSDLLADGIPDVEAFLYWLLSARKASLS